MLLRATALVLSLALHGLVGNVLWLRLQPDQVEALDLGESQEIFLEPPGKDLSEVTNIGDDLQSIEQQAAVAVDQLSPPPPTVTPLDQPQSLAEKIDEDAIEPNADETIAALDPLKAPVRESAPTEPEAIRDVIASEEKAVEQDLVDARGPVPDRIEEQKIIAANPAKSPDEIDVAAAKSLDETQPDPVDPPPSIADETPRPPDEIKEPTIADTGQPSPPDQLMEPALETSREPFSPITPLDEHAPDDIELIAQPDQVVIVTEHSSGEEKKGGDASIVKMYLGKINERVQQAKVNPRSGRAGTVVVKYTIGTDGALLSKEVISSSGAEVLDRAAISSLERAAPFPAIPPDVSARPMTFTQTFRFLVR